MTERSDAAEASSEEIDEPSATAEEQPAGTEAHDGGRRGRGTALLAVVLALAAAGTAGWAGWQSWQLRHDRDDTGGRTAALAQRVDELDTRLQRVADTAAAPSDQSGRALEQSERALEQAERARQAADQAARDAASADRRLTELAREVSDLQSAMSSQGERLDQIASRVDAGDDTAVARELALAGAESLVRTAYQLLELERDPARATRALALAADSLEGVGAPGLTRAREAIARELEAVRAMPRVDRETLAARLAALADQSTDLPRRENWGPGSYGAPAPEGEATGEGERGWLGATRDFLGEYFTVRRTDEAGTALPDPATLSLMGQVLRLELEQARLALLRGDGDRYRGSLERARGVLQQYFAADSPAVTSALEALAELRDATVEVPVPEHGAALEALAALRPSGAGGN